MLLKLKPGHVGKLILNERLQRHGKQLTTKFNFRKKGHGIMSKFMQKSYWTSKFVVDSLLRNVRSKDSNFVILKKPKKNKV